MTQGSDTSSICRSFDPTLEKSVPPLDPSPNRGIDSMSPHSISYASSIYTTVQDAHAQPSSAEVLERHSIASTSLAPTWVQTGYDTEFRFVSGSVEV